MGLEKEVWLDLLVPDYGEFWNNDWFLDNGYNANDLVSNGYINYTHIKDNVEAIINPAAPLTVAERNDEADRVKLFTVSSGQASLLPKLELEKLPYDKRNSVLQRDRAKILQKIAQRGIHYTSPFENGVKTPVLNVDANNAVLSDGFKEVTTDDLSALRTAVDNAYPELINQMWMIAAPPVVFNALRAKYSKELNIPVEYFDGLGNLRTPYMDIMDFRVYKTPYAPYYNSSSERKAFGSANIAGDLPSITAFCAGTYMVGIGDLNMYMEESATHRGHIYSFDVSAYAGPMSEDAQTDLKGVAAMIRTA